MVSYTDNQLMPPDFLHREAMRSQWEEGNCLMNEKRPTSKQHYVPCVYLKQFSTAGPSAVRESSIWRLSQHMHKLVPVRDQCYERNCYSATESDKIESLFGNFEGRYGVMAQRIWKGDPNQSIEEYFGLMFFIVSLHLRNCAYEVDPELGCRGDAYYLLEQQFVHHYLMDAPDCVTTPEQQLARLKDSWRVSVCTSASENRLITSDNPALWFSACGSGNVDFMILPVTSNSCAIAYNRKVVRVVGDFLVPADVKVLNIAQVMSCQKALYSDAPFSEDDQRESAEFWSRHNKSPGFVNMHEWQPSIINYKGTMSFISVVESSSLAPPANTCA